MSASIIRQPRLAALATLALALPALAVAPAQADVSGFYKGKTINGVIGYPPGGGYDLYMRTLARHMGRHLPGNPNIVPRNMPGAGSLVAANYIYNTAPKDGSAIGIFASSTLFSVKLGEKGGKFEIDKFTWIGNLDQTVGTCTVWHTSGIKSFEELMTRETIFGSSGPTAVNSTHARGFNALFGTRIKVINGYPSATSALLAMKRGEVQGGCGFALSSLKSTRAQEWASGDLKVVIQTGYEKNEKELKGVPHIYEYAKSDQDKQVMHLIYGTHILGRPISAPPALPADRARALRDAFNAMVKDPKFLAETEKLKLPIAPWTGEKVEEVIRQFAAYPKDIYDRTIKILEVGEVINVKLKTVEGKVASVKKRNLSVTDASGKTVKLRVHPKQTSATVGGKKAKATDIKAGMSCRFEYFGEGDLAPKVACQ
jgi:tripartite-type tricarboxylate transporter receptor subunit TctC